MPPVMPIPALSTFSATPSQVQPSALKKYSLLQSRDARADTHMQKERTLREQAVRHS